MANDVTNVVLGRCEITFNSVDLGHTKEGTTLTVTTDKREVTVDQFGSTPVAVHTIGQRVEVKVQLAELTLANLNSMIPDSTLESGSTVDEVNYGKDAGNAITPYELVLTPQGVSGQVITIWKAVPMGDVEIAYKTEEETVYEVTFVALIDESKTSGERLMRIGLAD